MAIKSAEFVYSGLGEGELLQKRRNIGQFSACGSGSRNVGAVRMKILDTVGEQRDGYMMGARF